MDTNRKLNILQIVPTRSWGGGEQYIYDLGRALNLYRQDPQGETLFTVRFAGRESPVIRERFSGIGPFDAMRFSSMLDIKSVLQLGKLIKKEKIGLIHTHIFKDAFMALFAKKLSGADCRIVMTRHLARRGKFSALYKWLYRNLDALIFVSRSAKDAFLEPAGDKFRKEEKFPVIPLAVPEDRLKECSAEETARVRKKMGIPDGSFVCGYCGRLAFEKGVDLIAGALEILYRKFRNENKPCPIYFLLAGGGEAPYIEEVKSMLKTPGAENHFLCAGYVKEVSPYISASDAGLFPSRVPEAFGLSALEFMSMGKPVIVSRLGAQQEIVENDVCGLHTGLSAEEIARAVYKLFSSPDLPERYGRNARQESGTYNYRNHLDRLTAIYLKN